MDQRIEAFEATLKTALDQSEAERAKDGSAEGAGQRKVCDLSTVSE